MIVAFPGLRAPAQSSWQFLDANASYDAPWGGQVQDQVRPGGVYACDIAWSRLRRGDGQKLEAFAEAMRGNAGRVRMPHWAYQRQGTGSGNPQVSGSQDAGMTLETSGWSSNAVGVLLPGDLIELEGNQLVRVREEVIADSNGMAIIELVRPLGAIPSSGSAIEIEEPRALFRLAEPSEVDWRSPAKASTSMAFIQDITQGAGS